MANGAHGEVAGSRYSRNDTGDSPVRTHATVTTTMFDIIERELPVSDVVAFGVVDGNRAARHTSVRWDVMCNGLDILTRFAISTLKECTNRAHARYLLLIEVEDAVGEFIDQLH